MERCRGGCSVGIRPIHMDTCRGTFSSLYTQYPNCSLTPIQLLCVIPVPVVRWVLVGLAFLASGWFLVANVYPILATVRVVVVLCIQAADTPYPQADAKPVRLIIVLLAALHAAVALCFKVLFFSYYIVNEVGPKDPIPAQGTL